MLDESKEFPVEEIPEVNEKTTSEKTTKSDNLDLTLENKLEVESEVDANQIEGDEENIVENSKEVSPSGTLDSDSLEKTGTDVAVDEIDNKIAESSENKVHDKLEVLDYNAFSFEELVSELSKLVKENPVQSIGENVNKIKNAFNIRFGELIKQEKAKFVETGGNIVEFQFKSPMKSTYNSILYDYKIKRNEYFSSQKKELQENLLIKLDLIEELKNLIENAEGATMYKLFNEIQNRWRAVGPIPRAKYNDTWRTYHHHVERFYDLLHLNNDLRDLDFKHNLEEKLKLVAKAEELTELKDINTAFKELQELHKLWKEEVGPVARENREKVWERFSAATKKVHDKRHDYFKNLKSKYEENVPKKLAVISEIAEFDASTNKTRSDWQQSIKKFEELRNKFFSIGRVPRSKSDQIWQEFKEANKIFNTKKNEYFKKVKNEHLENLNKKKLLIEQAVSLKDSEDWDVATDIMKKIQADWRKIGHVPRKYSDKLWKEFKDACNHYFDRLHAKQDEGNKVHLETFNQKKILLNEIKEETEDLKDISIDTIKKYVSTWRDLGRVPYEVRHIEVKFNKLLDKIVESSSVDKTDMEMIKFEILINSYVEQKKYNKLDSEQLFIRKKIDESIKEIQQLENNISFISNVSDDNPLIANVKNNISLYKENLEVWKVKLDYLRKIEY
jgi:hypothetical protein